MPQDLSEVSVAIGELRAGQSANNQALLEIKNDVKTIVNNMMNLPPSPACIAEHARINERIDGTDKKVTWLSAKISAALVVGATAGKVALAKLGIDLGG